VKTQEIFGCFKRNYRVKLSEKEKTDGKKGNADARRCGGGVELKKRSRGKRVRFIVGKGKGERGHSQKEWSGRGILKKHFRT